jgi:hypothetical protein
VQASREGDGALGRVNLAIAELLVVVRGDKHVDVLDVLGEGHEHVLRRQLQLEEGTVELVHGHHGPAREGLRRARAFVGRRAMRRRRGVWWS